MLRIALLLTGAAAVGAPSTAPAKSRVPASVPFSMVALGHFSQWTHGPLDLVVDDAALWQLVWDEHVKGIAFTPPLPEIDFSTHAVLAVFMGDQPSSGHWTEIAAVTTNGVRLDVFVVDHAPGASCITSPHVASPFHFVKIPKTSLPVAFHHAPAVTPC